LSAAKPIINRKEEIIKTMGFTSFNPSYGLDIQSLVTTGLDPKKLGRNIRWNVFVPWIAGSNPAMTK
jgi:hypothetical protein